LRLHLQRLESLPATTPIEVIQQSLNRELGPLDRLGVELEPPALAEASVAVVVPFRCAEIGSAGVARRGVFKVLKPGIEERLSHELKVLQQVGGYLDERCAAFGIPPLEYREVFDRVGEKLGTEVNLEGEQHHLRQAAETYAHEPEVLIPGLLPFCTPRVTAMERIEGHKVTEAGAHEPHKRRRLAELIIEALIAGPIWSPSERSTFHADPHAGNLFVTPDRRLAVLDWSLTGTLSEAERVGLTQMVLGGLSLSPQQVAAALDKLSSEGHADEAELTTVVQGAVRSVRLGQFPGFSWLTGMLDDAVLKARLRPAADLILFRKVLLTLDGVLVDVSEGIRIDDVLPLIFVRKLISEWPQRLLTPPFSRALASRLSTGDLTRLILELPWTAARACLENTMELFAPS
jgi:ubiquinone biosynthesis protein